jgi:hypothetical protein
MKSNLNQILIKLFSILRVVVYQMAICLLFLIVSCNRSDKPSNSFIRQSIKEVIENRNTEEKVLEIDILRSKLGEFKSTDGKIFPGYSVAFNAIVDISGQKGFIQEVVIGFAKNSKGEWNPAVIDWGINSIRSNPVEIIQ